MNRATAYAETARANSQAPASPTVSQGLRHSSPHGIPPAKGLRQASAAAPVMKKGPGSATEAAPSPPEHLLADDAFRLQVKEATGLILASFSRDEIAELTGISESRLDNICRETGNKNLFAFEVPALTAATGSPALLEFLAQQVGYDVDRALIVRLGRIAAERARLEKEWLSALEALEEIA